LEAAGVAERIEVRIGPAAERFVEIASDAAIDLVFIDADKASYPTYLDLALERLSPRGIVAVDNVLWGGAVADPSAGDDDTVALRRFNRRVLDDPDLDVVMLGVGDGLSLIRPR
jgi:caffeoyl-CoA O-methyltransferase